MKITRSVLCFCFLMCFVTTSSYGQLKVFIRLDDFGGLGNKNASKTLDSLLKRKIKFGIGVIANKINKNTAKGYPRYLALENDYGQKLIEVWYHGYDHSSNNTPGQSKEFKGTSYDFQDTHFTLGDERVREILNVQMHTFGAPFNASDNNTIRVIKRHTEYKVLLGGKGPSLYKNGILYLNNAVRMEDGTGNVDYQYFMWQYTARKVNGENIMVLQGHPWAWDTAKLKDFLKIIDRLKQDGAIFMLPYEFYLSKYK